MSRPHYANVYLNNHGVPERPCRRRDQNEHLDLKASKVDTISPKGRIDVSTQATFGDPSCGDGTSTCSCRGTITEDKEPNAKNILDSYLQSATIHGIAQSTGPKYYFCRRPIWLILIIFMAVFLSIHLYREMTMLSEYPIKTVSQVSLNTELTFPAVTICNINQYIRERVPHIPIVQLLLYRQSEYSGLTDPLVLGNATGDLDSMADVPGEELKRIMLHAAPRPIHTEAGTCFVFNGPNNTAESVRGQEIFKSTGTWSDLRVIANTQNNNSYYSSLIHAGVKVKTMGVKVIQCRGHTRPATFKKITAFLTVVVHEQEHFPFPKSQGWFLRPGVSSHIALTRTDSIGLPRPYKAYSNSYCEDTKAADYVNTLTNALAYSELGCIQECVSNKTHELCGCQHYATPGDLYPVCSSKQSLQCLQPTTKNIRLSLVERISSCACPKECETVSFTADLSYADFASRFIQLQAVHDIEEYYDKDMQYAFRHSVVDARIYFKSLNIMETVQQPALTRSSILGSLGGKMGLFLGASILSITELAEILLLLLVRAVKRCGPWAARRCSVSPHVAEMQ